ncbi:unnamed protein product [Leptosia nina]|uniref:PPM-type phosphatase domain-containing protein n=1 Tax=Leptosia nina TaxID=320188 RepID=A0AAV1K134_9NEOP
MNYTNVSLIVNGCLKLDRCLRKELCVSYSRWKTIKPWSAGIRCFRSYQYSRQGYSDDVNVIMSPEEVTNILRKVEFTQDISQDAVKYYENNQLEANNPIEDTRVEAKCKLTQGILFGVFDGHGGPECAQVVAKRAMSYIAASLLPPHIVKLLMNGSLNLSQILEMYNVKGEFVPELQQLYHESFQKYLAELSETHNKNCSIADRIESSLLRLDFDMSHEALSPFEGFGRFNERTLSVALSGAVACVAYVNGPNLHIANIGDCAAVLGQVTEDDEWCFTKITKDHSTANIQEIKRIWDEHPTMERNAIIRSNRLLGILAPLRSLGDFRLKWPVNVLKALSEVYQNVMPSNYHTPPYLTAKPEMFTHRLAPKDKFLIIGSDGLWDTMSPLKAVKLVGEHMKGKMVLNTQIPEKDMTLGDINDLLINRKKTLRNKPKDSNSATHLIRHAVGGIEDHISVARQLSLPLGSCSREVRDDITVTVIFFDSEYLRQCPA